MDNYRKRLNTFKNALEQKIILPLSQLRELIEQYGDDYSIEHTNNDIELASQFDFSEFHHKQMQSDIEKELALLDILQIQLDLLIKDNNKIKDLADLFNSIQKDYPEYNNGQPKILVFSYFADTVKYLEKEFKNYFKYNENECAFITSSNRNNIDNLTRRFAPRGKDYQLKSGEKELRYLFATDVLSEGQNLQDCAILINYDLHWNPVRMIQRNGRINRIGSENDTVLIYNMHPNSQLEEYLKLVKRLEYKIGLIRDIVGQDQRILNADEKLNPIEFFDDIEIDKLQDLYSSNEETTNKILTDLEDDEEYLTDDKFITDLRYFDSKYKNSPEYKEEVYSIPRGKFGKLTIQGNQLLVFTQMNDISHNKLFNKFFMINNKSTKGIDDLHALELIRTNESNNQRQISQVYKLYLPYLDKTFPQKFIATLQSLNTKERELDTGMQNLRVKFLRLLHEINYTEQSHRIFEQALLYSNHSDYNVINKKLKKLLKAPTTKDINQLLELCEKSTIGLDEEKSVIQPSSCEGILYYGN